METHCAPPVRTDIDCPSTEMFMYAWLPLVSSFSVTDPAAA